ncbi:MAG: DoxX family protein [Rhizobacter sp.]|nr:DoxX family protein [Ferruginibacter sp.]
MSIFNHLFLLRLAAAIILPMHAIPSITSGPVNGFGNEYLRAEGFDALGLPPAWATKLSHIAAAICLLANKFIKPAAIITLVILIAGILMIHGKEGWFVVGGGRNGAEFNFLLVFALLTLMYPGKFST